MLKEVEGGEVAINPSTVSAVRTGADDITVVAYAGGEVAVVGVVGEVILKLLAAAGARVASEGRAAYYAS